MELLIIKICIMFLSISNICLLVVVTKLTDKVNLLSKLSKLIAEILNTLGKEEDDEC